MGGGETVLAVLAVGVAVSALFFYKRRGDEARRSAEMLHSLVSGFGEGVVVTDRAGHFLVFNSAAGRLLGPASIRVEPSRWASAFGMLDPATLQPLPVEELPLCRALRGETVEATEILLVNARAREGVYASV